MKHAFTLIELLIVVAIIAILAAIAVPNFLEAQTRSKVSRTKSDMRTITTGLEAYYVDSNAYPNCHMYGIATRNYLGGNASDPMILERLSTPVAYLTSITFKDPFKVSSRISAATAQAMASATKIALSPGNDTAAALNTYMYQSYNNNQRYTLPPDSYSNASLPMNSCAWVLHSCGPDCNYYNLAGVIANDRAASLPYTIALMYDPTNGTVSTGSIFREGGSASATATYAAGEGLNMAIRTAK